MEFISLSKGLLNPTILQNPSNLLCLQSNCVARRRHLNSLHDNLFKVLKFGDPYAIRRGFKKINLAYVKDQPKLGTFLIESSNNNNNNPQKHCSLAFLFAQYNMGTGNFLYFPRNDEYVRRCNQFEGNKCEQRLYYFKKCLNALAISPQLNNYDNIYFPYKIGCATAGGDWKKYRKIIKKFSMKIVPKKVYIVSRN